MDAALKLASAGTIVSSVNGTALDFGAAFTRAAGQPMQAVIPVTSFDFTTGDETYAFKLQESADNVTFSDASPSRPW